MSTGVGPIIGGTDYQTAVTALPQLQGQVWKARFLQHARNKDQLSVLEGPDGSGACFSVQNELKAARGDKIWFNYVRGAGRSPTRGEARMMGREETPQFSGDSLIIDYLRHALSINEKHKKVIPQGGSLEGVLAQLAGEHFGVWRQRDMLHNQIRNATSDNTVYPNGKSALSELRSADIIDTDYVEDLAGYAELKGVKPASVDPYGRYSGMQKVHKHFLLADQQNLRPMKHALEFQTQISNADVRGDSNALFTGQYKEWDGNVFLPFRSIDDDVPGPVGSPILPRAFLGTAISGTTQAVTLYGKVQNEAYDANDDTQLEEFVDFPGYDYKFTENQTAAPDSTYYHALVIDPAQPGKFGFICYQGSDNTGTDITTTSRWTTLDDTPTNSSFDGSASPWSGNMTEDYGADSLIIPCNTYGVPYAYVLFLGQMSAMRAYGEDMRMIAAKDDYEFVHGHSYRAMYGQTICTDAYNRPRNFLLGVTALQLTGVNLPTVT